MKTLLMFGDSWAAGAELSDDEKPFGKILAESNNLIYKDFSLGGCSNPKMLLQLNDAIEKNDHEDSIAIFFLTSYTRIINWRDIAKSTIKRLFTIMWCSCMNENVIFLSKLHN